MDGLEWNIYYLGDNVGRALNPGHVPHGSARLGEQMDRAPSSAQEAAGEAAPTAGTTWQIQIASLLFPELN